MVEPDERVALVTGGSRGIGFGIARCLVAEGWRLVINGRRPDAAVADALEELRAGGGVVSYVRADVSDPRARRRLLEKALEAHGRIDALVNNAGITSPGRLHFLDASEEAFDLVISTNLKAPYFLAQAVAATMIKQRQEDADFRGRIVNITSVNATVVAPNRGDYCLSKAGLSMGTKVMAVCLAEHGIDCFEVRPGIIATDMTAPVRERYDQLIAGGLTLEQRWGEPEDVGKAVAALLRGDLAYATGQVLTVDGGLSIGVL
jgi:NAD(P)-dependent dehydrogenase (short-subunit alcohol dehydrogenase family)